MDTAMVYLDHTSTPLVCSEYEPVGIGSKGKYKMSMNIEYFNHLVEVLSMSLLMHVKVKYVRIPYGG